jgi:hypothetical protein
VPSPHAFTCSGYAIVVPALSAIARSVCATSVMTAIPVVNAKVRMKIVTIFFMVIPPFPALLIVAESTITIRDRHHVLEGFPMKSQVTGSANKAWA